MKDKRKFEKTPIGTIVQSTFIGSAQWFGKIVKIIRHDRHYPRWLVESICTADGRKHRKKFTKELPATFFRIAGKLPTRYIDMESEE